MQLSDKTAADTRMQSIWLFVLQWVFPVYCFAAVASIPLLSGERAWASTFFYVLMVLACCSTVDVVRRGVALTSRPDLAEPTGELLTLIFGRVVGFAVAIAMLAVLDDPADKGIVLAIVAVGIGGNLEGFVSRRWRRD